jgi:hypothetical protein
MNNTNTILTLILALVIGLSLFFVGRCTKDPEKIIETKTEIVRDTIINVVQQPPIVIYKAKPVIEYQTDHDTVIITRPFIAKVDTIIVRDTVHAEYVFPQNTFSMVLKRKADSVITFKEYIIKTEYLKDPWYEKPLWATGGILLGYMLGKVK